MLRGSISGGCAYFASSRHPRLPQDSKNAAVLGKGAAKINLLGPWDPCTQTSPASESTAYAHLLYKLPTLRQSLQATTEVW